ncbi:RNA polymerase subunit sigma-70 [Patulibacter sp. SYSU D01012]|uniref:RNA polymerase subunit sigma-70 n=1 Tax=Patulibacter sp. SYSU D01012 TaxID=2817381 RepID=UPI001B306272|nr:RNA polymerase subunit sigma-70 [Patulibacter sp. SYSU D01012]
MSPTSTTDRDAFEAQVRRHARELHVHCYRMTGSLEEAEDLVQETFLRAWRKRGQLADRTALRAWLYRIATNACLDALDKRPRAATADGEILWLQPYPDALLDELPSGDDGPEAATVAKETIELTFLTAIQHLAPLPRAVLVLRDVLDLSARETAEILETTVASVNSALQRARAGVREHLPEPRAEWRPGQEGSAAQRDLLARYVAATERVDLQALLPVLHEDLRFSMPPQPGTWDGRDAVVQAWIDGGFGTEAFATLRCLVTACNRQPAVAAYVRAPGTDAFRPLALDVLRVEDGRVREIVTFDGALFGRLGLPATVPA